MQHSSETLNEAAAVGPTIGILAGMGPRSTSPFLQAVLDECERQYGAREDRDYPAMMIYSLPTPFVHDRPLDHAAMARSIEEGARRLAGCGVDFMAVPCNTAHLYYRRLQAAAGVPVLHIADEAARELAVAGKKTALFSTRPTAEEGLYQRRLEERGVELYHSAFLQEQVDGLIGAVKHGESEEELRRRWKEIQPLLNASGAEAVLSACTDLSPLGERLFWPDGYITIDAGQALARATVREYLQRRGDASPTAGGKGLE